MKKKRILIAAAAVLVAAAIAAGWRSYAVSNRTPMILENGAPRQLGRDEADRVRRQLEVPGAARPDAAAPAAAAVRRNIDTINQVNRINQMNRKQNGGR